MKGPNFFDRRRKQEQMAGQSAEIEKLKAEVEAARLQLEKGAEQGVSDREFLIEQMIKNGELLDAVRQALEHFASIPGLDQLNEEDRGRLEDLKKILSPLEEREIEIKGRIATISDRPEVMGKLKDTAQQEHTEIIRRELEESYAELGQKINIIAESILSLAKLKEIWFISESNTEIRDAWEAMLKVVRQEIRNLESKGATDFASLLYTIFCNTHNLKEFSQRLIGFRGKLGPSAVDETDAINAILAKEEIFAKDEKTQEDRVRALEAKEEVAKKVFEVADNLRSILVESWDIQNRINKLSPGKPSVSDMPFALYSSLLKQIDEAAGIKAPLKYGQSALDRRALWEEAMRGEPDQYRAVYNIWQVWFDVIRLSDCEKLAYYIRPNLKKRE